MSALSPTIADAALPPAQAASRIHRVALYFAPAPQSPWEDAGQRWLGRCARSGQKRMQPRIEGVSEAEFRRLTADPRRYGWHATLKAPFELAEGASLDLVRERLREICAQSRSLTIDRVRLGVLGDFLAIEPADPDPGIRRLADALVQGLHPFARPLTEQALTRRRAAGLSALEDSLLLRWGYPFVMEAFRLHFSLTGALGGTDALVVKRLISAAQMHFAGLPDLAFDRVSLFIEPEPMSAFIRLEDFELDNHNGQ